MNPITLIAIVLAAAAWVSKKREVNKRAKIITDLRRHRDSLLDRLPRVDNGGIGTIADLKAYAKEHLMTLEEYDYYAAKIRASKEPS